MIEQLIRTRIRRSVAAGLALSLAGATGLTLLSMVLDRWLKVETGLTRLVSEGPGFTGPELLQPATTPEISLAFLDDIPDSPRRFFSVRWEGYWHVLRDEAVDLYVGGDDRVVLRIDGETILERNAAIESRTISREIAAQSGLHHISVEFEQDGGGYSLNVLWAPAGEPPRAFDPESLFPDEPSTTDLSAHRRLRALHNIVVDVWLVFGGLLIWPAARWLGVRVGRYLETQRAWLRSASLATRFEFLLPPVIGLSYLVVLMRWFLDPGQSGTDGVLYRSHVVWPFGLLTAALAAL